MGWLVLVSEALGANVWQGEQAQGADGDSEELF